MKSYKHKEIKLYTEYTILRHFQYQPVLVIWCHQEESWFGEVCGRVGSG